MLFKRIPQPQQLASSWNHSSYFNFFFQNTTKTLINHQNFLNNQYLSNHQSYKQNIPSSSTETLHKVTKKVLSCQPQAVDAQVLHSHVPFKVAAKKAEVSESWRSRVKPYIKLTKPNLTVLVTLSSVCSYAISPYTASVPELLFLSVGTALCSGSANAINMGREPLFDAKMVRTSTRPVVIGQISSQQAYKFAFGSGLVGCSLLYFGLNPVVSLLGFLNIVLYGWIYTSLKRKHIINTWVGALVGAIPPLMGWAASSDASLAHPGAWCLAALLYAWQFPHFNALSHNIASQYKGAGYVMTAAENPKLNARVSLRYSLLMFPICYGLSYFNVTDWFFQVDSALVNGWLTYLAYLFWKQQKINYSNPTGPSEVGINLANGYARKLFWVSVYHLPAVLILAMMHKKGQWDRLFNYFE